MVDREISIKYVTTKNEHDILVANGTVEFKGLTAPEINKLERLVGKVLRSTWW